MNPLLDFTHEEEGVELKKDFHIDARARAAGTDFMESIVVVQVLDKLAKDTELGGLFDRSVEEIVHGGGGHGPSGMEHEEDPDERGEGIEVPAPCLIPKEVREKECKKHGCIEAGFREPEASLGFHNGRRLLLGDATGSKIDPVADESVEGEDANPGNCSLGHLGRGEMMGGTPSDPKSGAEHDQANAETDEIFKFSDSVGEMVIGGSSNGSDGEKSGKDREEVGRFLKEIAEDGERVRQVGGRAHKNDIEKTEGERDLKAAFACAGGGGGGHR